ncbi:cysteine-rich receptor-like protein kinase 15 [Coffea arabica]|uniref:Cysteine-rich receptor-like protein kinase 15 n=1 Tax=Coffea arabica TaxID=13443 RepID=A0A6P6W977_COFAR
MMSKHNFLINKVVQSCLLLWCCGSLRTHAAAADGPSSLIRGCQGTNLSDVNPYRQNLNQFLVSAAAASRTQDFNTSATGSDPSDTVYGLFMCRGDVSSDVCANCVSTASTDFLNYCSQMVGYGWYDNCLLRYSNQSFFSVFSQADAAVASCAWNTMNVSSDEADKFNQVLGSSINEVADGAANDTRPLQKFAVRLGGAEFSSSNSVYPLAQCIPELSGTDCRRCLSDAISLLPRCCANSRGCRVAFPSCMIWYELFQFYNIASPSSGKGKKGISKQAAIGIAFSTIFCVLLFVVLAVFLLKRRSRKRRDAEIQEAYDGDESLQIDPESLQYSLSAIRIATDDFSVDNKIGQGGFGPVYKGKLPDGQDIAVKRLSRRSGQGAQEFKNEIAVVAKLQHRNLVRLLGFCLEAGEKLLIYEFVPNKSLDYFLFDPEKQQLLDWSKRYKIITGIARGLLYLHEDSRLRIVHRDLKAGNILLDERMNPKIADFGMAKICGVDEFEGNTNRIAGTIGYMAPEYTTTGQFSVKSDVFSFGVVILEIIAGKKNSSFYLSEDSRDLLSYAWEQWRHGTPLAMLDPTIVDSCVEIEVLKCIQIGLLCVEEGADRRPMMSSVVYMLSGDSVTLPDPHLPLISRRERTESIPEELESDRSDTKLLFGSMTDSSSSAV